MEECQRLAEEYRNANVGFTVYRCFHSVRIPLLHAESETEAEQFCEEHGWEMEDENGFVWSLDYRETFIRTVNDMLKYAHNYAMIMCKERSVEICRRLDQ